MIISLEEEKLIELFKNDYKVYSNNVPRLFPRIIPWVNGDSRIPLSIDKTIKTEKRTLQNLALILFCILLSAYFKTSL